jgi:hypothetical protein
LRYYLYVSDRKVDMLYGQIPRRLRRRLATEAKVDLKVLSLALSSAAEPETRYSKLELVERYLDREDLVGSIGESRPYKRVTMPMRWGISPAHRMTFFAGELGDLVVGLVGSTDHLLAADPSATALTDSRIAQHEDFMQSLLFSPSAGPVAFSALASLAAVMNKEKPRAGSVETRAALATSKQLTTADTDVAFLAKVITVGVHTVIDKLSWQSFLASLSGTTSKDSRRVRIMLATPIYVAQAD